jgi:hypothetical protein
MDILLQLQQLALQYIVPLVVIIIGLFLAWLVARIGAFLVRRGLERARVDERASASLGTNTSITKWVSGIVFWVLFVVVIWQLLIGAERFFQLPTAVYQAPLTVLLSDWVVRLFNVGVFLLVAWLVASLLRFLVVRILNVTRVEERLGEKARGKPGAMNASIGNAVFWLTFLIFIPSILGSLGMLEVAASFQNVGTQLLNFIPGVIAAIIILLLGGLFARIVRQIVTGFLQGIGVDQYGERVGLSKAQNAQPLSVLLGTVVYLLVLVPVVVQALQVLNLPVISGLGAQLLSNVTTVILAVLGAAVILWVAYYVARFVGDVVSSVLSGLGVNRIPAILGFKTAKTADVAGVIGYVVIVAIMLLAVQGTAELFGVTAISNVAATLLTIGGQVLLGVVMFLAGIYLANVASNVILTTGGADAAFLANIARWAILIFVAFIALTQAGVPLTEQTFQIILVTIGVAAALAFGLGGREIAAQQLQKWFNRRAAK